MFSIHSGKGFHITFQNGVRLSSQIGYGNYCDNYNNIELLHLSTNPKAFSKVKSSTCEIAIFDKNDNWITKEYLKTTNEYDPEYEYTYAVKGYVEQEEWFRIFEWCKNYKHLESSDEELTKEKK